ncbi:MAG: hypothetical protein U1F36_22540 [Planctomycetota bacterium]
MPLLRERPRPAEVSKAGRSRSEQHVYYFDSLFLQRLQRDLTPFAEEEAVLVSGVRYAHSPNVTVSVPTSAYMPEYANNTTTSVRARPESVRDILQTIENAGQTVLARFHSHPGSGRGMVVPSHVDIQDQKHWEDNGYQTISAIVSRSSGGSFFVHMFAISLRATIRIIGRANQSGGNTFEIPSEAVF